MKYDITLSVWNRFWSPQLVNGLVSAGYRVQCLGTTRRGPISSDYRPCWSAAALNRLYYRTPVRFDRFRTRILQRALHRFESHAARHATEASAFWGWSGHHLKAFQTVREAGCPVILETGSTHAEWQRDHLEAVYDRAGRPAQVAPPERIEQMVAEYALADRICVPSPFVAGTFEQRGFSQDRLFVNPFGVDHAFWKTIETRSPDRPLTFVYGGMVCLRKGIHHLLRAWKNANLADARLHVAGGVAADAATWIDRTSETVTFHGQLTPEALRNLYRESDVYVLPSHEEGLARSVLEAMASGLAVIVTPETGTGNIVQSGEDGWLIEAGNEDALVEALRQCAANRDALSRMGPSAAKRVEPFSWDAYGRRVAQLARQVIGDP